MNDLQLFDGISAENRAAMMSCFKPEQRSFRRGETIRVYAPELEQLCLLASGRAHLYCMDSDGEYTLLEQYRAGDIFGGSALHRLLDFRVPPEELDRGGLEEIARRAGGTPRTP